MHTPKVVISQRRQVVAWLAFGLLALAGVVTAYVVGGWQGRQLQQQTQEALAVAQEQVMALEATQLKLEEENVNLSRGVALDSVAKQSLRINIADLQDQVYALEEAVAFYRGVMAPSEENQGLRVEDFALLPTSEGRRYRYSVLLTQVKRNHSVVKGTVGIDVLGKLADGSQVTMPLQELAVGQVSSKFRFKYFQSLDGELVLPEGFQPLEVRVTAKAAGAKATRIEKPFTWKVKGSASHVG